jgi:hypothetical protein
MTCNSELNRFYINQKGYLEAIGHTVNAKEDKPIVTAVRVEPHDICCDRQNYEAKETNSTCNDVYNHKEKSKGTIIQIR